jgi:hypothetical protein
VIGLDLLEADLTPEQRDAAEQAIKAARAVLF